MKRQNKIFLITILNTLIFSVLFCAGSGHGQETDSAETKKTRWEKIVISTEELGNTVNKQTDFLEKYINEDEQTLKEHLASLEKKFDANTIKLTKLRKELETRITTHEKLEQDFEDASSDMKTLEGTVRAAARSCVDQLKLSPVSFTRSNRLGAIESFLSSKFFPSIKDVSIISDVLFEEIAKTGAVFSGRGEFIGLSGRAQEGTIIQAGGFFLGFSDGKNTGFLTPAEPLPVAGQGLPRGYSKIIKSWYNGSSDSLCMDITHGAALEAQARKPDLSQWFEAGGMLLWPIFAIAIIGVLVIIYKAYYLYTQHRISCDIFDQLKEYLQKDNHEKIRELLRNVRRTPAASVLFSVIRSLNTNLDALDNNLHEASLNTLAKLERMLPLLGVLGAIAPLLGLLGTVTGMISTFQTITIFGTGDPRMLSTGISEALITTQAGLGVSIPFLLIHHLLKRRVNTLMNDVEESNAGFTAVMADLYQIRKSQD
ncbi:MAG: MotA/TolQ/ExbB proton channel family protein [Desulfobacteraceae bacterium]|jgi:biopolymer transport protein ExbB